MNLQRLPFFSGGVRRTFRHIPFFGHAFARCIAAAGIVSALLLLPGCAAMMKPATVAVRVSSSPEGANVSVTGRHMGKTPCVVNLDNKGRQDHQIVVSKDGYTSGVVSKSSEFGNTGWFIFDIILFGLIGLAVDVGTGAYHMVPDSPVHVMLEPDRSEPNAPTPPVPAHAPQPPPLASETQPARVEGKNPLRVQKWNYDQKTQTAEFEFNVVSEDADLFALRRWALQEIRQICNDEYAQSNQGLGKNMLGFSLVTTLDMPKFMVNVTVHRVQPMSHSYDARTRTGVLKVNIGQQGDASYAGAYKWALQNIDLICSSKEIALEAGQPLPPGAQYTIESEKTLDDGTLEITFKVVQ